MTYSTPPPNLRSLEQRIRNLETEDTSSLRRQVTMAMVVVGQMLPEGAVKGGTAMALRYASLTQGWAGFTGRVLDRKPPRPAGIPPAYVMQPFDVKLDSLGRPWRTVELELGLPEDLDRAQVEATCIRLFAYRRLHAWPPTIEVSAGWDDLYEEAIEGVDALPDIDAAAGWANDLIRRNADA